MNQKNKIHIKVFILVMLLIASAKISAQSETKSLKINKNRFNPGEIWPDNNGNHINAHGGGILYYEGTYYWFGEYKDKKSNAALTGVGCYSSKDLYNWKYEGIALAVDSINPNSLIAKGCILERPKVIYNHRTKKFVMYFHLELAKKGYSSAYTGVAVANHVTGKYKLLKAGRVNAGKWAQNITNKQQIKDPEDTKSPTFTKAQWRQAVKDGLYAKRDLKKGQMSRDMNLFVDDDGTAYQIYASEENQTLQLAQLTKDYLGYTGRYIRIDAGGSNEAPAIFKRKNTYYMITSGCTGWAPNSARLFVAKSIWGPWKRYPNPCRGDDAKRTFHGQSTFVLPVVGKPDAFIFMADRWLPKTPCYGRYIWLPIQFENNLPVLKWVSSWDLTIFDGM